VGGSSFYWLATITTLLRSMLIALNNRIWYRQPLPNCATVSDKIPSNKNLHCNQGCNQTINPSNFSKTCVCVKYNTRLQTFFPQLSTTKILVVRRPDHNHNKHTVHPCVGNLIYQNERNTFLGFSCTWPAMAFCAASREATRT